MIFLNGDIITLKTFIFIVLVIIICTIMMKMVDSAGVAFLSSLIISAIAIGPSVQLAFRILKVRTS